MHSTNTKTVSYWRHALAFCLWSLLATPVLAVDIGTAFTYQGVLKDSGAPADGSYDLVFRLFDAATGGSQVGSDLALSSVAVSDGLFNVELDFGSVYDGTALWLEIEVDLTTLGARQALTPTPHALYAATASTVEQSVGNPTLVGSLTIGSGPQQVVVSGRYAYVVDDDTEDLRILDVTEPSSPSLLGSVHIGSWPTSVFVSGRYAVAVEYDSGEALVIDVSDPSAPIVTGTITLGVGLRSVFVSGRYAYVAGGSQLRVIDISDPAAPSMAGSLGIGTTPFSVFVSGHYAYVVDVVSDDLKVIDVSNPSTPTLAGTLSLGTAPSTVFVSGRYAYVTDTGTGDLEIIDVSDPTAPSLTGSLAVGGIPTSVFVTGRYAYVTELGADELLVVDVFDPGMPVEVGSLLVGDVPTSVYVSGRYAYVVDSGSEDLKVIEISTAELGAANIGSLEAGSLQVRDSVTAQGQLAVTGGINVGAGGIYSDGNIGLTGTLAIANDNAPSSSPANVVQLYAEDVGGSSELKVRDEAGNVTTLSPHNFSLVGSPSEPLSWSYYSENEHGAINVDMLKAMRVLERLSGEALVHIQADGSLHTSDSTGLILSLLQRMEAMEQEIRDLRSLVDE